MFDQLPVRVTSLTRFMLVCNTKLKTAQVHLKEVYRVVPAYPIRQPYLGNWTSSSGLNCPRDPLHYSRRTDLEGLRMIVGWVDSPPITVPEKQGNTLTYLGGYFGDIWQVLETAMNAT